MHINDKDMFETIYKQSLSRRLLSGSFAYDQEREVIKFLKKDKGATYTQRLETMFNDMKNSDELISEFKDKDNFKDLPV